MSVLFCLPRDILLLLFGSYVRRASLLAVRETCTLLRKLVTLPLFWKPGQITCSAVLDGNLTLLKWVHEKGYRLTSDTMTRAVEQNNIAIVEWLYDNKCPVDETACYAASERKLLHMLQLLRRHHCPWDECVLEYAVENRDLDMVNWILDNDNNNDTTIDNGSVFVTAVENLVKNNPKQEDPILSAIIARILAADGHCQIVPIAYFPALETNNLECLDWLYETVKCPLNELVFHHAIKFGSNMSTLNWLDTHDCPRGANTFYIAAKRGNMEILKWMYGKGFPINEGVFLGGIHSGSIQVVEWLLSIGCQWISNQEVIFHAMASNNQSMLQWIMERGRGTDFDKIINWHRETYRPLGELPAMNSINWLITESRGDFEHSLRAEIIPFVITCCRDIQSVQTILDSDQVQRLKIDIKKVFLSALEMSNLKLADYLVCSSFIQDGKNTEAPIADSYYEAAIDTACAKSICWLISHGFDCRQRIIDYAVRRKAFLIATLVRKHKFPVTRYPTRKRRKLVAFVK